MFTSQASHTTENFVLSLLTTRFVVRTPANSKFPLRISDCGCGGYFVYCSFSQFISGLKTGVFGAATPGCDSAQSLIALHWLATIKSAEPVWFNTIDNYEIIRGGLNWIYNTVLRQTDKLFGHFTELHGLPILFVSNRMYNRQANHPPASLLVPRADLLL